MFSFNEIEKVVLLSGFEFRSSKGSHHIYVHKKTGFSVCIPKHPKGVSIGVSENVIKTCILVARLDSFNIGSYKNKFPKEIHNIIEAHHAKIKENKLFLISDEIRTQNKIFTEEDVINFIVRYKKQFDKANKKLDNCMVM